MVDVVAQRMILKGPVIVVLLRNDAFRFDRPTVKTADETDRGFCNVFI